VCQLSVCQLSVCQLSVGQLSVGQLSVWGRSLTSPHPRRASAAMLRTAGSE
jgi:hypothetical protein